MHIDIPRLPVDFMNEDHDHAAEQLAAMRAAVPAFADDHATLAQACRAFIDHNREHFAREEEAMQVTGFPPYTVHKGEHDRALAWLDGLADSIASGGADIETVRGVIEHDIPAWFIQHIQTMDWATANWISSHQAASGVRV
ncbi:MAG: hemerythrin family protein [Gallionellaceae bacterium]|nr:hemerythrin family protein [Gallionellaceae bacterium]MDD5365945.1 hemerythrin family protein [Gallionellaceae bacterium]